MTDQSASLEPPIQPEHSSTGPSVFTNCLLFKKPWGSMLQILEIYEFFFLINFLSFLNLVDFISSLNPRSHIPSSREGIISICRKQLHNKNIIFLSIFFCYVKIHQIKNFHNFGCVYESVCLWGWGKWGHLHASECREIRGQLAIVGLSSRRVGPGYYLIRHLLKHLTDPTMTISKFLLYWYLIY